jgi:hypothetical protein
MINQYQSGSIRIDQDRSGSIKIDQDFKVLKVLINPDRDQDRSGSRSGPILTGPDCGQEK